MTRKESSLNERLAGRERVPRHRETTRISAAEQSSVSMTVISAATGAPQKRLILFVDADGSRGIAVIKQSFDWEVLKMEGGILFLIYCSAIIFLSLLRLTLQFLSKESYYSTYKRLLDLLDWFFLGGAVFYSIMNWPW